MRSKNSEFTKGQRVFFPFKRFFDILFSFVSIVVLLPFFIVISIIVSIDTKGFPVFRQKRIGKNGKPFIMLKFRSMKKEAPNYTPKEELQNPDKFITKFGSVLRKSSIDELPQLFNVLFGQMSIVGPRPILCTVSDWQEARKKTKAWKIKPGLTGLAQCSGRDTISFLEKTELDSEYAEKMSLRLDVFIIIKTIKIVITKKDVIEGKQS